MESEKLESKTELSNSNSDNLEDVEKNEANVEDSDEDFEIAIISDEMKEMVMTKFYLL